MKRSTSFIATPARSRIPETAGPTFACANEGIACAKITAKPAAPNVVRPWFVPTRGLSLLETADDFHQRGAEAVYFLKCIVVDQRNPHRAAIHSQAEAGHK